MLIGLGIAALMNARADRRRAHAAAALAPALEGGEPRGRALGGVPPLPDRLPAPAGGAARDARAVGALPRLRHRVRHRRARAPGGAHRDARGARPEPRRSTGSRPAATSARARPRSRSAISRRGSARRSRRPRPARAAAAAASRAAAAAAAEAAAAAPGRPAGHVRRAMLTRDARAAVRNGHVPVHGHGRARPRCSSELGPEALRGGARRAPADRARGVRGRRAASRSTSQGDAFFFAFQRAADAVARRAGRAGRARGRPGARVRIGLHTGEPLVTAEGSRRHGREPRRAHRRGRARRPGARLARDARARPGRRATSTSASSGSRTSPARAALPARLSRSSRRSKSLNRTNLPLAAHPLVGRVGRAGGAARRCCASGGSSRSPARAASGKTRLALQVAAELLGEVVDGVFFVNLAEFADPSSVVPAVLEALRPPTPARRERRAGSSLLDNFEHLVEAAPAVAQLLARGART